MSIPLDFPNEIWRIIIRSATQPDDVSLLGKEANESRIARIYDPASLEDQFRYPWRKDFKLPVDTVTSLQTKHSLILVSRRFYALSCEYFYENLYLRCTPAVQRLAELFERTYDRFHGSPTSPSSPHESSMHFTTQNLCTLPRYIHLWIDENIDYLASPHYATSPISILTHTSPIGFIQIYANSPLTFSRTSFPSHPSHLLNSTQSALILNSIPPTLTHLEWHSSNSSDWMANPNGMVTKAMLNLLRRTAGTLTAIRVQTAKIDLTPGTRILLPRVKYMDMNAVLGDLSWVSTPQLTHLASPFYWRRFWDLEGLPSSVSNPPISRSSPPPPGNATTYLSPSVKRYPLTSNITYICLESIWSFHPGVLTIMLASVPSLQTLCVFPELSVMSSEADVGVFGSEGTGHRGLKRVEVHVARRGHWLAFRARGRGRDRYRTENTGTANPIRIRQGLEIGLPTHPHASSFYEDAEETFDRLKRHVRPFAEYGRFPALEEFELRGLAFVCVESVRTGGVYSTGEGNEGSTGGRYQSVSAAAHDEYRAELVDGSGDEYVYQWDESRREMVRSVEDALVELRERGVGVVIGA